LNNNSLQQDTQQVIAQADQLYSRRENIANIWKSIQLLRDADADSYGIAWRLSRALFFLGQESSDNESVRTFHAKGIEAGQRATSIRSDRVEGHFWLGVNLALLARLEPPRKAVGQILKAKGALSKAIAIEASYHGAGPVRVLARLQHHVPRLLGGGVAAARAKFERAIDLAPENTVTRLFFAELLLKIGEIERARSELEVVLNTPLDPDWAFEIERDQRLAEEMMKQLPSNRKP
jgi:tetratricopeptide (TPR) repeat protein